ncbi:MULTISPECIES: divergent PAP2 family protein [unclassified Paenibacillus]|uniref:divergent PAP2 family protein n=1 Tax=unclassified Paenibacillus TaxID=185978 RepID=UPI00096CBA15|nr:divergent PAP2 family protein [Paenibacillus sp. FSL H8-0259]OMF24341.1 acid phosphatase [Paenibacillus sp. FSL H8-0259]
MYYCFVPFVAWLVAGSLKYLINRFRFGKAAHGYIGNGGFPSNHTTVVTTITWLIGLKEGFDSPVFGLGIAVIMIVIFDATGLRRYVGNHARTINVLIQNPVEKHRERIGHTRTEVLGGLLLGIILGYLIFLL